MQNAVFFYRSALHVFSIQFATGFQRDIQVILANQRRIGPVDFAQTLGRGVEGFAVAGFEFYDLALGIRYVLGYHFVEGLGFAVFTRVAFATEKARQGDGCKEE